MFFFILEGLWLSFFFSLPPKQLIYKPFVSKTKQNKKKVGSEVDLYTTFRKMTKNGGGGVGCVWGSIYGGGVFN